jgi:triacylglycerol esterase/lipase EstA (alpha/beta hydrolase family)
MADYVDGIRARTGARRVDMVGYSEGGLIDRDYVKFFGGKDAVDSAISLGTPHNGVLPRQLGQLFDHLGPLGPAVPVALRQMITGSAFLQRLNAGDPTPGRVRWTSIMSAVNDGIVWPGTAPVLDGARNVVLPHAGRLPGPAGPNHGELIQRSDAAYAAVRSALLTRSRRT